MFSGEEFEGYVVPPKKVHTYDLVELIDCGAHSFVFKAHSDAVGLRGQYRVIKFIRIPLNDNNKQEQVDQWLSECRIATELDHPNIVKVFEVSREYHCIIMEYADGPTLDRYDPDDKGKWGEVLYRLALGLQYAHSKNVMHRDIKPKNAIATLDGPKLIDFSWSKAPGAGKDAAHPGTHVAPETLKCSIYNGKTEVWGLGNTIVTCLNGGRSNFYPNGERIQPVTMLKISGIRSDVILLLDKMTRDNPDERPSIDEVVKFLQPFVDPKKVDRGLGILSGVMGIVILALSWIVYSGKGDAEKELVFREIAKSNKEIEHSQRLADDEFMRLQNVLVDVVMEENRNLLKTYLSEIRKKPKNVVLSSLFTPGAVLRATHSPRMAFYENQVLMEGAWGTSQLTVNEINFYEIRLSDESGGGTGGKYDLHWDPKDYNLDGPYRTLVNISEEFEGLILFQANQIHLRKIFEASGYRFDVFPPKSKFKVDGLFIGKDFSETVEGIIKFLPIEKVGSKLFVLNYPKWDMYRHFYVGGRISPDRLKTVGDLIATIEKTSGIKVEMPPGAQTDIETIPHNQTRHPVPWQDALSKDLDGQFMLDYGRNKIIIKRGNS